MICVLDVIGSAGKAAVILNYYIQRLLHLCNEFKVAAVVFSRYLIGIG